LQEAFTTEAKAIGAAAGYAWQVEGPQSRPEPGNAVGGSFYLGETQPAMLDSGLVVLSDYPVLSIAHQAFPQGDCAGYDCLAAKGLLVVTVAVPDKGLISIAATHLNSRKASGAPFGRANGAYARQTKFVARKVAEMRASDAPLILAGDFNRGDRPVRMAALQSAVSAIGEGRDALRALETRLESDPDLTTIRRRGRDMQFSFAGAELVAEPLAAEVPFGTEPDGTSLSDHFGFVVHYRLAPAVRLGAVRWASAR
jgi:endonuclease/exonuclease/phosphatase family metal-dependent hydrolase